MSRILQSFVTDALRMSSQAAECLRELRAQRRQGKVSPAQVRSFYQLIHTLKGAAAMLPQEGAAIVEALEKVEGILACQAVTESAWRTDWLPAADEALLATESALAKLQARERMQAAAADGAAEARGERQSGDAGDRGLVALAQWEGTTRLLWFPLASITRVLAPGELAGRDVVPVGGAWAPVLALPPGSELRRSCGGICVRTALGQAVVAVEEIIGLAGVEEARLQGAVSGLGLLCGPTAKAA